MLRKTIIILGGASLFLGCHMEDPHRGSPGWVSPTPELTSWSQESTHAPVCSAAPAAGFWKRQCTKTHPSGEHEYLSDYVAQVSAIEPFTDVSTVEELCDRVDPAPGSDKCMQAEAQFMTLVLNYVSGRLAGDCCVDEDSTVADVIAAIEALLGNLSRTIEDCEQAYLLATGINEGTALCAEEPAPEEPNPEEPNPEEPNPEEPSPEEPNPEDPNPEEPSPEDPEDPAPEDPMP
jgi:hypothetical protein